MPLPDRLGGDLVVAAWIVSRRLTAAPGVHVDREDAATNTGVRLARVVLGRHRGEGLLGGYPGVPTVRGVAEDLVAGINTAPHVSRSESRSGRASAYPDRDARRAP